MNSNEPVAWVNKNLTYVELSTSSTVYGSHTIPLYTVNAVDSMMHELEQQLDVAAEFCRQYQIEIAKLKAKNEFIEDAARDYERENTFLKSENQTLNMCVEDSEKACQELVRKNNCLVRDKNHLQFLLDSVMIEYCPDEMTEEQMENWKKAQKVVDTANPEYYKSDTYRNNVKFSVDTIK